MKIVTYVYVLFAYILAKIPFAASLGFQLSDRMFACVCKAWPWKTKSQTLYEKIVKPIERIV